MKTALADGPRCFLQRRISRGAATGWSQAGADTAESAELQTTDKIIDAEPELGRATRKIRSPERLDGISRYYREAA
jgi:hypothetical protein